MEGMRTWSVCPVCRKRIPAERVMEDGAVRLVKTCPEHGSFSSILWRGLMDYAAWRGEIPLLSEEKCRRCASCAGLCADHLRNTCCVLLEVTKRCNMHCSFCFAEADSPENRRRDLNSEQLKARIFDLTIPGKTLLQLSGGEPTVREDLPELISFAIKCGCRYVQLNTNGIRLAEDPDYAKSLAEAGLSFVFLQFDGLDDKIYRNLRGRELLEIKLRAVENCGKAGLGVTLVPVIVPGVNALAIGEILRFGAEHSPAVRGVHFQPVSYFGRAPHEPEDRDRFTLDELLSAIFAQSEGLVKPGMLGPSCCDHPMCGLHGDFIVMPDKSLYPLTHWTGVQRRQQDETPEKEGQDRTAERGPALPEKDPAEQNREFIGRRWKRPDEETPAGNGAAPEESSAEERKTLDMTDMDTFLARAKSHGFTITSMNFQDAWNLDLERLVRCSLHVYRDGRLVPFCANYL